MKFTLKNIISALICLPLSMCHAEEKSSVTSEIDWPSFISKQDMIWDGEVPKHWLKAPYLGNGMIGLLLFQEGKNVSNPAATNDRKALSLHVGRGDYYDNRKPDNGKPHTWIYRSRLPIGFYDVRSKGDVKSVNWRLDLWKAKLVGTVKTSVGSYEIESVVHADFDSFYFKVTPDSNEEVSFAWKPQEAYSHPRSVSDRNAQKKEDQGEELTGIHKQFTSMPYPKAPEAEVTKVSDVNFSRQVLYGENGELITAWKVIEDATDRSKTLLGSISFSQKMGEVRSTVEASIAKGVSKLKDNSYMDSHEKWWSEYYPQSFVSVSDDFWEQFYWAQMYKFASATRADGMMLDVMGPWYQPGFWPMIWTDLNVQLTYWTHLTANRLDVGASLMNKTDQYAPNLINNVAESWREDCLNADTIFPADMIAPAGKKVADHMIWMLHNYWLQCRYADDNLKMKTGLFPLLKRALNTNMRYLEENPLDLGDGKIHYKSTWSPEYPGGTGVDVNYTIALTRWACKTLLDIDAEHKLNDPKAEAWKNLLANLAEYQIDETGLRIGRDIPFNKGHRHYSHLLSYYPLYDHTPEKDRELLKKSVDHWLAVAQDPEQRKVYGNSITGYTCTGAASMYAGLNDGDTALGYLRMLPFNNVSCTTMYAEGNPVIESPFSAATAMHDMLLQSWGDTIRIMPGVPSTWEGAHFRTLLCEGGALVSADRSGGALVAVLIESPKRERNIRFKMDMKDPQFSIIASDGSAKAHKMTADSKGFYHVKLAKGGKLQAKIAGESVLAPVKSSADNANIFGLNKRYAETIKGFKK